MAKLFRSVELDRSSINAEKRTIPVCFSSEFAVDRGDYLEILDHNPENVDLSLLSNRAPALDNHDFRSQLGVVETPRIDADKKGRATLRFSKADKLAEQRFQEIQDEIRPHASVGYNRTRVISKTRTADGRDAIRFAWQPFEISSVPIGADPNAGAGRSAEETNVPLSEEETRQLSQISKKENHMPDAPTIPQEKITEFQTAGRDAERKRIAGINSAVNILCTKHPEGADKFRELATTAISEGKDVETTQAALLAAIPGTRKADTRGATIELGEKDQERYSILRAVRLMMAHKPVDGLEKELSDEIASRSGYQPEGFFVPHNIMVDIRSANMFRGGRNNLTPVFTRDMNVTTGSQGGDFVPTNLVASVIELLRNKLVTERLGVQTLTGLSGNVSIPRQTGAATAYSLSEQAVITKSTQAIDQIALSPKRVGAWNNYSKQLLIQTSPDVENFVRDDLMKVMALKVDKLTLEGSGAGNEPTGILSTTGIGSVTFGAAATFAKLVEFETKVSVANADVGSMAYLTSPAVRGVLKSAAKLLTGATTVAATALWEKGNYGDGSNDGEVNGHRAAASNQISNNLVAFGNWEDEIAAYFGGFDVVVDQYSQATEATVRIVINQWIDAVLRHAASFTWSTDAGNQ